jgi:HEAT repeat protein
MSEHKSALRQIEVLLAGSRPEELRRGLELFREELWTASADEAGPLLEVITPLFYIDPLDRPDLVPFLDEAIRLVVGSGAWTVPLLVEKLDAGDLKAQMAIAHALGGLGSDAVGPLLAEYRAREEPARRAFILYSLGKVKSEAVARALPAALEAAGSADRELRDTATRVLGKFAEVIPASELPEEVRKTVWEALRRNLADPSSAIRAKAVRSLGKLARYGYLSASQRKDLEAICRELLGEDERADWERAYIVRKEAREALGNL